MEPETNSLLAIAIFALSGFTSAAFYAPLKFVKWKWEAMWIFYSVMAFLVAPMVIATVAMPSCWDAIGQVDGKVLGLTFLFGALWGVGGLTFGLSMRYLGIGLGTAIALGCCALFGTLINPAIDGKFVETFTSEKGFTVLVGVFICALGIGINGFAGIMKEKDTAIEGAPKSEFNLSKGLAVAVFAGLMSACMAISMKYGEPIAASAKSIALQNNVDIDRAKLFMNSPILIITLWGGFLTNFLWCLYLAVKNNSFADLKTSGSAKNIAFVVLCAVGGLLWYCQFFLYGMGQTKLSPDYAFVSWGVLMSFIIVFAGLIGLAFGEWKGTTGKTKGVLWLGIVVLIASTFIMTA